MWRNGGFPGQARPIIPFLLAGVLGLTLPQVLGGGNKLVDSMMTADYSFKLLLLFMGIKFLFTMISYGSGAPGGIFLPLLVVGALIGALYSRALFVIFGYDQIFLGNFIILAMAGYFTAVVKAPITGILLITEMTGSFSNLLSLGTVCLCAYIVTEVFHSKPIYEVLLERISTNEQDACKEDQDAKILLEIPVCSGSIIEGKQVRDMEWPAYCLIVGIKRGEQEIIPKGDFSFRSGDCLVILTSADTAAKVKECIANLAGV